MTYYFYDMNGKFLSTSNSPVPDTWAWAYIERGVDWWNVTMTNTGIQTINGSLQRYIQPEPRTLKTLNWTIVVS
jgi:hypothetical protein